jgi:2-C-methyl-D-erythritol 4-phosphate cytidylyltransferase
LRVFEASPVIQDVLLVVPPGDEEYCLREMIEKYGIGKVLKVVVGGAKRQDSVYHAIKELEGDTDILVVHDGVRPLVTPRMVAESVEAAVHFDGAVVAVPVKDSVKKVSPEGWILESPDRAGLWFAQTPQAFKKRILVEAYTRALAEGYYGTDDASLVEKLGYRVKVLEGSPENIKITTREDFFLAELVFRTREVAEK